MLEKIQARRARIGVIGLGYVGLPLAVEIFECGFPVVGIDVNSSKVESLKEGHSYVRDVSDERLQKALGPDFQVFTEYSKLWSCDAALVCVPTPLNKTRDPDVSYLIDSMRELALHLHPGMLVCLESTTYPGTTIDLVRPLLDERGLELGVDYFLAFSPERIDPGRKDYGVKNTPKVVGGATPACLEVSESLYKTFIDEVVPVSSTEAAEMVKLLENTFRAVNIALVNEIAIMCDKLNLDVCEIIEAAGTKPYGFMKFTPGPGVGGHCIPLDPHYLSWKLKTLNYNARFIQLAGEINSYMPKYWADKVQEALNLQGKPVQGSRILILGVAYKRDVDDVRESPALDILALLNQKGGDIRYHDFFVKELRHEEYRLTSEMDLTVAIAEADCVVLVTDHSDYPVDTIRENASLFVDTRHTGVREAYKKPAANQRAL